MFRRRPASRDLCSQSHARPTAARSRARAYSALRAGSLEILEQRVLLSAAFDITQLTNLRNDPNFSNINGSGIGVAVLDTGVFGQNPDLKNNLAAWYNAVEQPVSTPVDPNPVVDSSDNNGHGSHTSGIAASSNPSIGVAYGAKLIDIKVLPDPGEVIDLGNPFQQDPGDPIVRGLVWVQNHAAQFNIKVVNMSIGDGTNQNFTPPLDQIGAEIQTLQGMGITVVTASGNSYAQYITPGAASPAVESTISVGNSWPSNGQGVYDFSGAFGGQGDTFFATETSAQPDVFAATSQRSTLFNQVVAPGQAIFSTWNSPAQLHNTDSGTSMASPFVAGTVALMQQAAHLYGGRYLNPSDVLNILRNSADTLVDSNNPNNGRVEVLPDGSVSPVMDLPETGLSFKRVNVYRAIQQVKAFVQGNGLGGDNNNTAATAINLSPLNGVNTDTFDGNIGTDGQVLVGPKDVDLYKFTLKATGDLQVATAPLPGGVVFNATVRLFDSAGNEILTATGFNGASYPALQTPIGSPLPVGTYYVGVSSAGNDTYNPITGANIVAGSSQGDYALSITVHNPDPGGVPAAGRTLDLAVADTLLPTASLGNVPSTHFAGTIGLETAQDGSQVSFADGDVQFYQLIAPDTGDLVVQGSSTSVLTQINPNLNVDIGVFDQNYNRIGTEGSNLTIPVTIGQAYYIGVTEQGNQGFNPANPYGRAVGSTTTPIPYDLFVAFTNGDRNGTVAQATPATIGSLVQGTIGSDPTGTFLGANGGNKDVDFYSFTAPSAGVFDVTVSGGSGFIPAMTIWQTTAGLNGAQRLADAKTGDFHLLQQVTAGQTVLVAVTGQGNQNFNGQAIASGSGGLTGAYTLTTLLDPLTTLATLSNNSIQNATPTTLTLNQPITGNIGLDGDLVVGPSDVDMYKFTAPTTAEYSFTTSTQQENSADTVVRVFDQFGNQIALNDNASASTTASAVSVPMTAGLTYYIGVSGAGPGALTYNPLNGVGATPGSTGPYSILATTGGAFQRTVSFGSGQKATYIDAMGHKITMTLNGPGSGQVIFFSTASADAGQILISGTDATSTLTIHGDSPIGQVTINGSLKSFNAPQSALTGDFGITGSLGSLRLASATGEHTISIGSGGKLALSIGSVSDESLTSVEPIGTIRVGSWTTTGATRYAITAPSIDSIQDRGTFNVDVAAGTIGRLTLGSLSNSAVRATSSIGTLTAGSAAGSEIFAGISPTLTTLPTSTADFVNTAASIKSATVRGAFSNTQIAAWNIGSVVLGQVQPSNGGKPLGVAANRLAILKATVNGKTIAQKDLFAPLAPIVLGGDAVVRILG